MLLIKTKVDFLQQILFKRLLNDKSAIQNFVSYFEQSFAERD